MPKAALKEKPTSNIWPFSCNTERDAFAAAMLDDPKRHSPEFVIEKGVAMPRTRRRASKGMSQYPLAQMEVGDSFFMAVPDKDADRRQRGMSAYVGCWAKRNGITDRKFTALRVAGGLRIWRTA